MYANWVGFEVAVSRILCLTVHKGGKAAIIYLRRRLPGASSGLPGGLQTSRLRTARRAWTPLLLSGLAPDGVYRGQPVTRLPVSSYLTISPLPARGAFRPAAGGMFLWHFPWGRPHWPLASILLYGVRTFLDHEGASDVTAAIACLPRNHEPVYHVVGAHDLKTIVGSTLVHTAYVII
jgi:hypothetical protein